MTNRAEKAEQLIPAYAMLDIWMALGRDSIHFDDWYDEHGYADAWAELTSAVREARTAPAPLREEGVGWYEVIHPSRATTHIAYVHEDGSIYFPEGTQVLDTHEFAFAAATGRAHRLVRADTVDPAEGDGSADQ